MFTEQQPSADLSGHIECFWSMIIQPNDQSPAIQPPQGIYEIMFVLQGVDLMTFNGESFVKQHLSPGIWLIGQQTRCFYWHSDYKSCLFSARIKPFGLFNMRVASLSELKHSATPVTELIQLSVAEIDQVMESLCSLDPASADFILQQKAVVEPFMRKFFGRSSDISQPVRAMSNVIMAHRGSLKLNELCQQFEVSKVALRNRFLSKIGLLPKELATLWRLNYCLLLQYQHPNYSLTDIALCTGYYDQAHLTKEFKNVFSMTPLRFFNQQYSSHSGAVQQINKRLNAGYMPRMLEQ